MIVMTDVDVAAQVNVDAEIVPVIVHVAGPTVTHEPESHAWTISAPDALSFARIRPFDSSKFVSTSGCNP